MQLNQHQFFLLKSAKLKDYVNDSFCDFLTSVYRDNNEVVLTFHLETLNLNLDSVSLKDQCFFVDINNLKNKVKQSINNDEKLYTISFKLEDKLLPLITQAEKFMGEHGTIVLPYSHQIKDQMQTMKQAFANQKKDLQLQISNIDLAVEKLDGQIESFIKLNEEAIKIKDQIDKLNV